VLEESIAKSRAPAALYNRLAIALVKERRDYFRAEELINKAIQLEPGNKTYTSNLAKILMMIASYSGLVPIPDDAKKW
jgi:Flp pilus assembly protein TadD